MNILKIVRVRPLLAALGLAAWLTSAPISAQTAQAKPQLTEKAKQQMREFLQAKQRRTFVERKISTDLGLALQNLRGGMATASVPKLDRPLERVGAKSLNTRVTVEIRGAVSPDLHAAIEAAGGTVQRTSTGLGRVRARVPLSSVPVLAARTDVAQVQLPKARKAWGAGAPRLVPQLPALGLLRPGLMAFPVQKTGLLATQGIISHRAKDVHTQLGILGTGVKIGVLSDSVDFLEDLKATRDLPMSTTYLPGQSGGMGSSEGTAMLELIHDMAPGAQLLFATAFSGYSEFAANVRALRDAGCQIIVDDVGYFPVLVFQDDLVARAVNDVTASGVMYFSSAGNNNNLTFGTTGVWEGDAASLGDLFGLWDIAHVNLVLAPGFGAVLAWADPGAGSANDYDLFVFDDTLDLIDVSLEEQTGTQDPLEGVFGFYPPGSVIVVARYTGALRAMHLDTIGGTLLDGTAGAIFGHSAAESAMGVAAVNWNAARRGTRPFTGGPTNPIEEFSSDGPRRMFFTPSGSAITPGNFLFATNGGKVVQKPDFAAADGNASVTPGFTPFFGTSSAAPHAAAIAALIKSAKPGLTSAQILQIMKDTALDNMAPGIDRDSGRGIVMALPAVQKALE